MFKTFLAGAATLAALPVIAQTGNPTTNTPAGATTTPNSVATGNQVNSNAQTMPVPSTSATDPMMNTMSTTPDAMSGADVASDETAAAVDAATPPVADRSMDAMNAPTDRTTSTASTMQPNAYAGVGGPAEVKDYPMCSRSVTDSCQQPRGR